MPTFLQQTHWESFWRSLERPQTIALTLFVAVAAFVLFRWLPGPAPIWLRTVLALLGGLAVLAVAGLLFEQQGEHCAVAKRTPARPPRIVTIAPYAGVWLLLVATLAPLLGIRSALQLSGALLVLLVPGYLVSLLVFTGGLSPVVRILLAWALSVGMIPIPLEALNDLGIPFSLGSLLVSLGLITIVLSIALVYRGHFSQYRHAIGRRATGPAEQ